MNAAQKEYYDQVVSDFDVYQSLRTKAACHQLHYLQMITEKLARCYYYGKSSPVEKKHSGFRRFLRLLESEPKIWRVLGFSRREELEDYLEDISHLAIEIERLAPALAGNGPNAEYPWPAPPSKPLHSPATFNFPAWQTLQTERGKKFLEMLALLIKVFPARF